MKRQARRGCIRVSVIILATICLIETGLRVIDPTGVYRYRSDQHAHINDWIASPRGYGMPAGVYQYSNWSATIDEQGNRVVPDAMPHECRIAILGDSVAFGFGVDDADTFANGLARDMDAEIINAALTGFTSENVLNTLNDVPADGYIYMAILNDDDITHVVTRTKALDSVYPLSALATYFNAAQWQPPIRDDIPRFERDIAALVRDDVLIVTFEWANGWHEYLQQLAPATVVLPMYKGTVSAYDRHPNARGHAEIAAALMPYVREFEEVVCAKT